MSDAPDSKLSEPCQALWWLKKGNLKMGTEWNAAHELCQRAEGTHEYDLVHALCHWIEGDMGNHDYWYRRVGGGRAETVGAEWDRVSGLLAVT